MRKYYFFLILLSGLIFFNNVFASSAPPQQDEKKDNSNSVDNATMKTFLGKIEVYGRIAKPQTVFIIPGTDPRVDGIRIERRFFGNIFRDVEKSTLRKQKNTEQRKNHHLLW